jgi:Carboxypeptidase regulatory-like domain
MRFVTVFGLLLISIATLGQASALKGHATNNEYDSFPGLNIEILSENQFVASTVTDGNGNYVFTNIKPGEYTLRVRFLMYEASLIEHVKISSNEVKQLDIIHSDPRLKSKEICPKGHRDNLIPIIYGLPSGDLIKMSEDGIVKLGGCLVSESNRKWHCKKHHIDF